MSDIDLTEALSAGFSAAWPGLPPGMPIDQARRRSDAAITAAAPLIQAAVREQVAREIEADRAASVDRFGPEPDDLYIRGFLYGQSIDARIARGDVTP